jgi:hypothetical protein
MKSGTQLKEEMDLKSLNTWDREIFRKIRICTSGITRNMEDKN